MQRRYQPAIMLLLGAALFLIGCSPAATAVPTRAATAVAIQPAATSARPQGNANVAPPATPTPLPTATQTPTPVATATATATATPTPTATPIGPCSQRLPGDNLLPLVTLTYGLSRDFAPTDLLDLNDVLPQEVTLGYATEIRAVIADPLAEMIADMQAAGLQPQVLSGYRSYSAQAFAWDKWSREFPDRASILSAPPGHSEHQLGTTIDFGSPELASITGDPDLQFHTYFYQTSEGAWLLENAHRYGFTLSYPLEAFEITGFYYEPWHYRYVGAEMAAQLKEMDMSLTEFLLATEPEPCIPD